MEGGEEVDLRTGDCIVLPAGVAHCCRNTISFLKSVLIVLASFVPFLTPIMVKLWNCPSSQTKSNSQSQV